MAGRISRRRFLGNSLAALGAFLLVEGNSEANTLEITHHIIQMPGLAAPLKLVQLTDLHRSLFVSEKFIARVVDATNALHPDVILLTGDFVTGSSDYAESCVRQLARLQAPLGKYAVLGNHDYHCDNHLGGQVIAEALETAEIETLVNRSLRLKNGMRLVGVDDLLEGVPDIGLSFAEYRLGEPTLIMTHNPGIFELLRSFNHVTLAGHTHGGQLFVPGVTRHLVRSGYVRGWYQDEGFPGRLYISRGLGTIHVPLRLCSVPEIALFHLQPV